MLMVELHSRLLDYLRQPYLSNLEFSLKILGGYYRRHKAHFSMPCLPLTFLCKLSLSIEYNKTI